MPTSFSVYVEEEPERACGRHHSNLPFLFTIVYGLGLSSLYGQPLTM